MEERISARPKGSMSGIQPGRRVDRLVSICVYAYMQAQIVIKVMKGKIKWEGQRKKEAER